VVGGPIGPGPGSVAARAEAAVPSQRRLRAYRQSEPMKRGGRESVQQYREERPVAGGEPRTGVSNDYSRARTIFVVAFVVQLLGAVSYDHCDS